MINWWGTLELCERLSGCKRGWVDESSRLRICPNRGRRFESYRLHFLIFYLSIQHSDSRCPFWILPQSSSQISSSFLSLPLHYFFLSIWEKKTSATENWTRVSCVTGRDNSHYTIADQLSTTRPLPLSQLYNWFFLTLTSHRLWKIIIAMYK